MLRAADGAVAWYDNVAVPGCYGIVLVRRGGYAVGRVEGSALVASKCGTRYVQGRTKAGGQSQKRYARRRANQAEDLAHTCAAMLDRVLAGTSGLLAFGGGDRELVRRVLALAATHVEPAERWLDVGEPRYAVLQEAVGRARAVRITLNDLA